MNTKLFIFSIVCVGLVMLFFVFEKIKSNEVNITKDVKTIPMTLLPSKQSNFTIWKIIELGTYKSVDDLRRFVVDEGVGGELLGKIKLSPTKARINLVRVFPTELGFKDGVHHQQIYDRAKELGLDLCPAESGPQLRLQYPDQPKGEVLSIAMEPITDSHGLEYVFFVERNTIGPWLGNWYIDPLPREDGVGGWSAGIPWVFCFW